MWSKRQVLAKFLRLPLPCGSTGNGRILVTRTLTFNESRGWRDDVDLIDERRWVNARVGRFPKPLRRWARQWFEFQFGVRLLLSSRGYRAVAVGRYGIWLPVLQRLLRIKRPVVMTDVEWPKLKDGKLNRAAARGSAAVLAFTNVEASRYSRQYRIPREKFALSPAAFQESDIHQVSEGGYIFSGGGQARDWETLAKAVEPLQYPVRAFGYSVPFVSRNMTVGAVSREQYFIQMAGASCVVITLKPEPLRITGMATWVTAMAMGKVVIVTEPLAAQEYMEQGVSGFYTDYGDWEAVRRCIVQVMDDARLRRRIGQAARERAWKEFSPGAFRSRVLSILDGQVVKGETHLVGSRRRGNFFERRPRPAGSND